MKEKLKQWIEQSEGQAISFYEYMNICLYSSPDGYYMREQRKTGPEGDFYTSSFVGSLLGEMIASYIAGRAPKLTEDEPRLFIIEWGGGDGRLALQVLNELKLHHSSLYDRVNYISVEASPFHRKLQEEMLAAHTKRYRIVHPEQKQDFPRNNVFIVSNELLDAFPVHRIMYQSGGWHEQYVGWNRLENQPSELWKPLTGGKLLQYVKERQLPEREGQQFEVNLRAVEWLHERLAGIDRGEVITIDYGDLKEELTAEHRMKGTLMCYRKHQAADQPFLYPGEQDMTSHVNFTDLMAAGEAAGADETVYMTQKKFLIENGLLQKLQEHANPDPFSAEAKRNRAIRQLLLSDQMSELFKVLIQRKNGPKL